MSKRLLPAILFILALCAVAAAQEVEIDRYGLNARLDLAANSVEVRAALSVTNLGQASKTRLYLRLNKQAKISAATVGGSAATFEVTDDRRASALNQVLITSPVSIPAGGQAVVELTYRIEAPESNPLIAIYYGEVLLAPEAIWVPMTSTPYTLYGAPTAPISLTVSSSGGGIRGVSSGIPKEESGGQSVTFEQHLNSLPLIVGGAFDPPAVSERAGIKIVVFAHAGLTNAGGESAREQVSRVSDEAARMADFFTRTLGPAPSGASFTMISSSRAGSISVPGALVMNEQVFRQDALDAPTIELLADGMARLWIDGRVRVRGQDGRPEQPDRPAQRPRSAVLLRDSTPRYLASLYIEDRFGRAAAADAYARMRSLYTPIALSGRDAEMSVQSILLPTYGAAAFGKGPLVLRLMAETAGRDKLIAALRSVLAGPQNRIVNTEDFRSALVKSAGQEIESLFQQWVDTIIEPDIIIGVPQPGSAPGSQRVNLRNLGNGTVSVSVLATTASGKKISKNVIVGADDLASVDIPTDEKISAIEADPEKLIIQKNYDNDSRPVQISPQTLLNEGIAAFTKGEFSQAETKFKDGVRADSNSCLLHAWLSRSLLSQSKLDDAASEANLVLKLNPPIASALAYAHMTLGAVAMARNQSSAAVEHLRRAVVEANDAPAQFAAHEQVVKAERAASKQPPVEESIRAFVTQIDSLIKQPSSDKLFALVSKCNLKKFVQGLTVTPPAAWTTEILRVDRIDANRAAVDVAVKATAAGREQSGTAVFVLYKTGAGWMLEDIQLFNVK